MRKEVLKELLSSGFFTETWIVETLPALTFTYRYSVLGLNRLVSLRKLVSPNDHSAGVAELGSLSSGAKMALKIFVKHVLTILASNASFLHVIANLRN